MTRSELCTRVAAAAVGAEFAAIADAFARDVTERGPLPRASE